MTEDPTEENLSELIKALEFEDREVTREDIMTVRPQNLEGSYRKISKWRLWRYLWIGRLWWLLKHSVRSVVKKLWRKT